MGMRSGTRNTVGEVTTGPSAFDVIGPMSLRVRKYEFSARLYLYRLKENGSRFFVLEKGECKGREGLLVRIESACLFAHLFHSAWCDCEQQLEQAFEAISREEVGLLIYALDEDGRDIGLENHVRVYMKQDEGYFSTAANEAMNLRPDQRDFSKSARIVSTYQLRSIRLLTNNPARLAVFEELGIKVKAVPLVSNIIDEWNIGQLSDKQHKLHHLLQLDPHSFWLQAVRRSLNNKETRSGRLGWLITSGGRKAAAGTSWNELSCQLIGGSAIGHEVTVYLVGAPVTCPPISKVEYAILKSWMKVVVGVTSRADEALWRQFIERVEGNGVEAIAVIM